MDPSSPVDAARLEQMAAEVARTELREDKNTRKQILEQFRDWIQKNPDIKNCPTDDNFLLQFLRVRKFSLPLAEQTIIKFMKTLQTYSQLVSNPDVMDPIINDVLTSGYIFVSPYRAANGQLVICVKPNYFDTTKYSYETAYRVFTTVTFTLFLNEHSQIFGVTLIFDFGQAPMSYFTMFPPAVLLSSLKDMEGSYPMRFKEVYLVNLPQVAAWFLNLVKSALSEKMQGRFKVCNSSDEFKQNFDPKVLPKEYGGTMSSEEMIRLWKEELIAKREKVLSLSSLKLVGDSFKNELETNEFGISDVQGSFRKLTMD